MRREEQDKLAEVILSILDRTARICRTDILKLTLRQGGTPATFNTVFSYLRRKEFIEKLGPPKTRAPYQITEKGKKFLEIVE